MYDSRNILLVHIDKLETITWSNNIYFLKGVIQITEKTAVICHFQYKRPEMSLLNPVYLFISLNVFKKEISLYKKASVKHHLYKWCFFIC